MKRKEKKEERYHLIFTLFHVSNLRRQNSNLIMSMKYVYFNSMHFHYLGGNTIEEMNEMSFLLLLHFLPRKRLTILFDDHNNAHFQN